MKTALLFAAATLCLQAGAQLPYLQEDHSGTNLKYNTPVDIEFDGAGDVYTLHLGPVGMVSVRYDAASGNLIDVTSITHGNNVLKPVRVRTLAGRYYILFNGVNGSNTKFCLARFDATLNTLDWAQIYTPPTGALPRTAYDFVLDGGPYAYILSMAYDNVATQGDIAVTKVDIAATTPVIVWDNVYQNLARSESPFNIAYRGEDEIVISAISYDLSSPFFDRGPMVMRILAGGGYLSSKLYKYSSGSSCSSVRPTGTWVAITGSTFFVSGTSMVGADGNGPLWLARIDPVTLAITVQSNYSTGPAYMYPEIQPVLTSSLGTEVLISGAASPLNTSAPGYVHAFFDNLSLLQEDGTLYPTTNPQNYGSPMYDRYITTGTDKNIFSVALNSAVPYGYHLLKTSQLGDDGCDSTFVLDTIPCHMDTFPMPIVQVPVGITPAAFTLTLGATDNTIVQSCIVPCPDCIHRPAGEEASPNDGGIYSFPNPTTGKITLSSSGGAISDVSVYTIAGALVPAAIRDTGEGTELDLSGKKPGIYVVRLLQNGERKTVRVMLE